PRPKAPMERKLRREMPSQYGFFRPKMVSMVGSSLLSVVGGIVPATAGFPGGQKPIAAPKALRGTDLTLNPQRERVKRRFVRPPVSISATEGLTLVWLAAVSYNSQFPFSLDACRVGRRDTGVTFFSGCLTAPVRPQRKQFLWSI